MDKGLADEDIKAEESAALEGELDSGDRRDATPARASRQQLTLFAIIGLLLVGGIVLLLLGTLAGNKKDPASTPIAIPSIDAFSTPLVPVDPKLSSLLQELQRVYIHDGEQAARELAENNRLVDSTGRVYLTVDLDTDDAAAQDELVKQLEELGVQIDNRFSKSIDVSFTLTQLGEALAIPTVGPGTPIAIPTSIGPGNISPTLLGKLSDLKHIQRVRLPRPPSPQGMTILADGPEGVHVVHADEWQRQGITGKGMKIGILDVGGFLGYKELLGKELPKRVTVKAFNRTGNIEGNPTDDDEERVHGTACAEIVHAMAPDAELYFAAFDSNEENAIKWLISQGVTIISASYGGNFYPTDGKHDPSDGILDRTHEEGIFWAVSSGNEGDDHYKGLFEQGKDGLNIFYNGTNVLGFDADAGSVQVILRWNDWEKSTIDYDLYLLDDKYKKLSTSEDAQNGSSTEPLEVIRFKLPKSGKYYLAISGPKGVRAVEYDIFVHGPLELEKSVASGSLGTPGDAAGAFTVGAVRWDQDTITSYSSQGPTDDGRLKPNIAAPSGVTSASYGRFGEPFHGTSASAPFVAGAAGLVWSANPNMKVSDVEAFLLKNARDLGTSGPDNTYGSGLLDLGTKANTDTTNTPGAPTPEPSTPEPGAATITKQPPTAAPDVTRQQPTTGPDVPTPGPQPTVAPLPVTNSTTGSGGSGAWWMAVLGGSMVGMSLIMGVVLLAGSGARRRRNKYQPPSSYGWPPPQGGTYPQQPPPGQPGQPGYPGSGGYGPGAMPGQHQGPPPQQPPYGQAPYGYSTPPPGQSQGQQPGYPVHYPPQQPPMQPQQPPGYGSQGYPAPGQQAQQSQGYPPAPGYGGSYGGQAGQPPQPAYQPQPQPQSGPGSPYPQPQAPGPVLPQSIPPQYAPPQGGYPVAPQHQLPAPTTQPTAPVAGPGGRPLPPPPKGMTQCPNCGRILGSNAVQCDNCGWRKP
jgi:hypothetical protein